MRVFSDKHHSGLSDSLVKLFCDRLKGQIFFPLGMEWYPEFWKLNDLEATARQFLEVGSIPSDGTTPLNPSDNLSHRITLEEFKNTKFDLIIASIPQHVEPFIKLRDLYQPQAALIMQIGNSWSFDESFPIKNILASAKIPKLNGFNQCEYHQEFSTTLFYTCTKCQINVYHSGWQFHNQKKVYSFINCLGTADLFKKDWELFLELEKIMSPWGWEFKSFGGQCRDGWCTGDQEVAEKMREASFIYQVKAGGDGYGHIIHQAAAMGKPLITRASDYKGKLAEVLINDPSTAITVDGATAPTIAALIQDAHDHLFPEMSTNIYKAFLKNVDFDKEQIQIEKFLSQLK